jgi:hypothetical protein
MANMLIPNEGKLKWLQWALYDNGADFEDYIMDLYQNAFVPTDTTVLADFVKATFPGYASVSVPRADWNNAVIVANIAVSLSTLTPTFSCNGGTGQTVVGWYLHSAVTGKCLATQAFAFSRNMVPGTSEVINPFQIALDTLV